MLTIFEPKRDEVMGVVKTAFREEEHVQVMGGKAREKETTRKTKI
jgi:hypothetical protein